MTTSGIRRTSPPQAVQKIRDGVFMVQVGISSSPSADWRRLFYDAQQDVPADFPPRSVEISGTFLRFKADPATVEQKIATCSIAGSIAPAKRKQAWVGARKCSGRRRKNSSARRTKLAEWNARWARL